MDFADDSACLMVDNIQNEVATIYRSQILKNAVILHVGIPCFSRRHSDLTSEVVLQEYLQFHCKWPISFNSTIWGEGRGYCDKLCPSKTPRKNHKDWDP
jgi:hypothetical protein